MFLRSIRWVARRRRNFSYRTPQYCTYYEYYQARVFGVEKNETDFVGDCDFENRSRFCLRKKRFVPPHARGRGLRYFLATACKTKQNVGTHAGIHPATPASCGDQPPWRTSGVYGYHITVVTPAENLLSVQYFWLRTRNARTIPRQISRATYNPPRAAADCLTAGGATLVKRVALAGESEITESVRIALRAGTVGMSRSMAIVQ